MKNVLTTISPEHLFLGHTVKMTVLDKGVAPDAARFDAIEKLPHFITTIHNNATGEAYAVLVHLTRTEGAAELHRGHLFHSDAGAPLFGLQRDPMVPAGLHEFIAAALQSFVSELGGAHALAPAMLTHSFAGGLQRMNWHPIAVSDELLVSVGTRRKNLIVHYKQYTIERRLMQGESRDTGRPDYRMDYIQLSPLEAEIDDIGFYNSPSRGAYRFGGFRQNTRRLMLVSESGHKYHVVNSQAEGLFQLLSEEAQIAYIEELLAALLPELQGYAAVFEDIQPVSSQFARPSSNLY